MCSEKETSVKRVIHESVNFVDKRVPAEYNSNSDIIHAAVPENLKNNSYNATMSSNTMQCFIIGAEKTTSDEKQNLQIVNNSRIENITNNENEFNTVDPNNLNFRSTDDSKGMI
ncbi:hypothetical protein COBT_003611, partial [Conglomerata obtusa]